MPNPAEAEALIQQARNSLLRFARFVFVTDRGIALTPEPHHALMCWVLERPWLGDTAMAAPPDHAKTTWVDVWIAWYYGHNPGARALYVSATEGHAIRQSLAIRETIEHNPNYHLLFPWVEPNKQRGWGAQEWFLKRNSNDPSPSFLASGREGKILGVRSDIVVLDDINDELEQLSPTQREKTKIWVSSTPMSRRVPGGRVVVIQTRWHESDIIGWSQEQPMTYLHFWALAPNERQTARLTIWDVERDFGGGESNTLPVPGKAITERVGQELTDTGWQFNLEEHLATKTMPRRWTFEILLHASGPALWPKQHPQSELLHIRDRRMGAQRFANMYQGLPVPEGGSLIPIQKFKRYKTLPRMTLVVQAWDTAFSTKSQADWSVCVTLGLGADGNIYVLDVWRDKVEYPKLKQAVRDQFLLHHPEAVLIEDSAAGKSLVPDFRAAGNKDNRLPIIAVPPQQYGVDKVARIASITGYIDAEKIYIPEQSEWLEAFLHELGMFNRGDNDDQVDAFGIGVHRLIDTLLGMWDEEDDDTEEFQGGVLGNVLDWVI